MIGLDTNLLVRYLAQDDPVQSPKVAEFIAKTLTETDPGFVSAVVLAETAWVLESAYHFTDSEIASAIEQILQTNALRVEHEAEAFVALTALQEGRGSFADALIGAINAQSGCSRTVTFDRKTIRLPGFQLL